jgi:predicted S18 family serine protease
MTKDELSRKQREFRQVMEGLSYYMDNARARVLGDSLDHLEAAIKLAEGKDLNALKEAMVYYQSAMADLNRVMVFINSVNLVHED